MFLFFFYLNFSLILPFFLSTFTHHSLLFFILFFILLPIFTSPSPSSTLHFPLSFSHLSPSCILFFLIALLPIFPFLFNIILLVSIYLCPSLPSLLTHFFFFSAPLKCPLFNSLFSLILSPLLRLYSLSLLRPAGRGQASEGLALQFEHMSSSLEKVCARERKREKQRNRQTGRGMEKLFNFINCFIRRHFLSLHIYFFSYQC